MKTNPNYHRLITIVMYLTAAVSCTFAQNLITNGSFEMQAYAGDGYIYSTDPNFSLPGWTVPTGGNQFFLEYGQPFGRPRYLDGRQAVCINADGVQLSLSQTFSTAVGQSYILSFGLAEEQTGRPSPTAIRVSVAGVTQDFFLGSNPGYAIETLNFTASAASTTLSFTDITSGSAAFDSPFIDAVSVIAVPEPSTVANLLSGVSLSGAVAYLRRRRSPC